MSSASQRFKSFGLKRLCCQRQLTVRWIDRNSSSIIVHPAVLPNNSETGGDSTSQRASKPAKNQALSSAEGDTSEPPNDHAKVPSGDRPDTIRERCSDKLDNKLSNKPDAELDAVVQLPDAIRSAILMLVRASIRKEEG